MNRFSTFILVILISTISSCDREEQIFAPQLLLDKEIIVSFTKDQLSLFIQQSRLPFPEREIKYDVDIYKVTYLTQYKGKEIEASGLVILPRTSASMTILSFQHGTIISHAEAPTATSPNDDIMKFYASMSTPGIIGVVPDYIGFGSSTEVLHPYYVEKATADAVVDNIRAARELARVNKLQLSNRLLLAGYSQGGYATMAAHKKIEEEGDGFVDNLELIASFPAAGGYDVKGMQEYFFTLENYDQPFYMTYVAAAYKQTYDWNESLDLFFKEPFASKIPALLNGSKSGSDVNKELTETVEDLIQEDFLKTIDSNPKYSLIVDAFNENSLTDWVPTRPMFMYHGDADITVPFNNSIITYNKFIANGASPEIVTITPIQFGTHSSGVTPYIIELINKVLATK